jgi:hypothetical protein
MEFDFLFAAKVGPVTRAVTTIPSTTLVIAEFLFMIELRFV